MIKDKIVLTNHLPGKGLAMTLWCENTVTIERFKEACYGNLTRETQWFHQCNCDTYQMFEFWISPAKLDVVKEQCASVASTMKMELHIDVDLERFHYPA